MKRRGDETKFDSIWYAIVNNKNKFTDSSFFASRVRDCNIDRTRSTGHDGRSPRMMSYHCQLNVIKWTIAEWNKKLILPRGRIDAMLTRVVGMREWIKWLGLFEIGDKKVRTYVINRVYTTGKAYIKYHKTHCKWTPQGPYVGPAKVRVLDRAL